VKCGAPYFQSALSIRNFMDEKGLEGVTTLHRFIEAGMGSDSPKYTTVYMAWAGARPLPLEAVLYLQPFGLRMKWRDAVFPKTVKGVTVKTSQLALPGMRELKR
jgi:hypothetical protein